MQIKHSLLSITDVFFLSNTTENSSIVNTICKLKLTFPQKNYCKFYSCQRGVLLLVFSALGMHSLQIRFCCSVL